jgi:hypothetical protein
MCTVVHVLGVTVDVYGRICTDKIPSATSLRVKNVLLQFVGVKPYIDQTISA